MSPKSSWRKYGSLEDGPKPQAHRSPGERASVDAGTDRSSFDFDPSLALRRRAKGDATSRWFALVVVGMVAVGVMISLSRAGYRLPKVTRSSTTTGDIGGNQNMVVVGSAADKEEVAALHQPSPREGPIVAPSPSQQEGPLSKLEFTAVNPYHVRDGKPAVDYPWLKDVKLIEPFRETTLSVTSPREGFEYRWVVHGHAPGEAEQRVEAVGETAVVVCTVLDENNVMLDEVDVATGAVVRRLEEKVMVKYVRREIRTLTDDEREELFDAVRMLRGEHEHVQHAHVVSTAVLVFHRRYSTSTAKLSLCLYLLPGFWIVYTKLSLTARAIVAVCNVIENCPHVVLVNLP